MEENESPGEKLNLIDLESRLGGKAEELAPQDRVRLKIATNLLVFVGIIVCLAILIMIFSPDNRVQQAEKVFEFVKTFALPIVTLVIGFYFRSDN